MKRFFKVAFIGSVLFTSLSAHIQAHAESDPVKVNQCNWSSINNNIDSPERRKMCYAQPEYVLCMDAKMGSNITRPDVIPDDDLREMISMCSQSSGYATLNHNDVFKRQEQLAATQPKPDIEIRDLPPVQIREFQPRELQANGPLSPQYVQPAEPRQYKPVRTAEQAPYVPPAVNKTRQLKDEEPKYNRYGETPDAKAFQCYEAKANSFTSSRKAVDYKTRTGKDLDPSMVEVDRWLEECKPPVISKQPVPRKTALDQCVSNKVEAVRNSKYGRDYQRDMGWEVPMMNDQLEEFKNECKEKKPKKSLPIKSKVEDTERNEKKNDVYAKIESCIDQKIGKSKPSNEALQKYSQQCENKYNKPSIIDVPVSQVESTYSKGQRNVKVQLEIKI